MAYYGQPIIEGLKGLGQGIRQYGQTQAQMNVNLGAQQVELAKMEAEAPLKAMQYGQAQQKYLLGAEKLRLLEEQKEKEAQPFSFTDYPDYLVKPVAKAMNLEMVDTEQGQFAQKADGSPVTVGDMRGEGGRVARALALSFVNDPMNALREMVATGTPEQADFAKRLLAGGEKKVWDFTLAKRQQAQAFVTSFGVDKQVLAGQVKSAQARVKELRKRLGKEAKKTGVKIPLFKYDDKGKLIGKTSAKTGTDRYDKKIAQGFTDVEIPEPTKTDLTPSVKQTIIRGYKSTFGLPRDTFGKIIARSDPESRKLKLSGWINARAIEEKSGRFSQDELDGIEQSIMTELEMPFEEQHSIRSARMAGATAKELLELLGVLQPEKVRKPIKR